MSEEAVLDTPPPPEKRSLDTPLLAGALVVIAAMAAWFFLGSDDQVVESAPAIDAEPTPEQVEIQAVVAAETPNGELLSRARLAADSGMLAEPAGSNALYYYALFLEQAPAEPAVAEEVDNVLDRVGAAIGTAIDARDWARAAFLVEQLNNAGFEHGSIARFRNTLETYRLSQSRAALAAADEGDEAGANAALERIAALPRTQTGEVLALRADVRDRLDARRVAAQAAAAAAERERAQREASARAARRTPDTPAPAATESVVETPAPAAAPGAAAVAAVRDALAAGRLRGTEGAATLLAAVPADAPERAAVRGEVVAALADGIRDASAAADPGNADRLYREYDKLAADGPEKAALERAVDTAFIARATAETVSAATLRRTKAVAPIYPRRAIQRGINGRVKVEFTVDVDGQTREIDVVESDSGEIFDRSALRAISEWEYEPRVVRGQPVAQRVYAYLDYNLE